MRFIVRFRVRRCVWEGGESMVETLSRTEWLTSTLLIVRRRFGRLSSFLQSSLIVVIRHVTTQAQ